MTEARRDSASRPSGTETEARRDSALRLSGTKKTKGPTDSTPPMVEVEHLVKQFGKLRAVNNVSMTIQAGETYGLIGPNGSGKTTLIRMLVGLVKPTSGSIQIMHERMPSAKIAPHIGYMTQLTAIYNDLTARENLRFFCNIYGLHGKGQKQRIDEMLERVDLADR